MSLRRKFNIIVFSVILITSSLVALMSIEKQQELISKNIEQQATSIVSLITQNVIKMLVLDSPQVASELKIQLEKLPELQAVQILDKNNKVQIEFENSRPSNESIVQTLPLKYDESNQGNIRLFFSNNKIEELKFELFIYLFEAVIFSAVLATLLAFLFDLSYSKRISKLSQALKKTNQTKEFNHFIKEDYSDEIGSAYRHYNNLIKETDNLTKSLRYEIDHDSLTGLYSRPYMQNKIQTLMTINPENKLKAICFLRFDNFKLVNDCVGHSVGDKFIISAVKLIQDEIKNNKNTCLGRTSGNEFILLVESEDEVSFVRLMNKLIDTIKNFTLYESDHQLSVGLSIGAILFEKVLGNQSDLLQSANNACKESKKKGGNRLTYNWAGNNKLAKDKQSVEWIYKVRNAIANGNLLVYLQPIVASNQSSKNSYEALVRLRDVDEHNKIISPFFFIEPLEKYGLMHELDFFMIEQVIKKISENPKWASEVDHISINLCANTVHHPELSHCVLQTLKKYNVNASKICFEITETTELEDLRLTQNFIQNLKEKGCKFSLDDFGTGMSSFDYLYKLPVDYLKIDGSFIKNINQDPVKEEMVKAMQNIANLMDLKTIAEYVENQDIVRKLNKIGIDYHQGYEISEPKLFESFSKHKI